MALLNKFSAFLVLAAINVVLVLGLVTGIELAFGDWFAPYMPPAVVVVNRSYTYHQELYEPPGDVLYIRDKYGLRGVHEPLAQVELVTVGGSTTDQRYITERETWQDALRSLSGIRVANAGADGMTSLGHVVAVTEWLHEIPDFRPKYHLHYIGVNDASLGKESAVYDRPGAQAPLLRTIRRRSLIAKAAEKLWFQASGPREVSHGRITEADDAQPKMRKPAIDAGDIEKFIETTYKPNLRRLIALHRQRSESVVFVSQPAHPAIVRWTAGEPLVSAKYPDLDRWAVALGLINRATEAVCRETADICRFSDLATRVRFELRDFYDLVHATPAGARKIGGFLAEELAFIRPGT